MRPTRLQCPYFFSDRTHAGFQASSLPYLRRLQVWVCPLIMLLLGCSHVVERNFLTLCVHRIYRSRESESRTSDLAISNNPVKPLSQAPAGSQPREPKTQIFEGWIDFEQARFGSGAHVRDGAGRPRDGAGLGVLDARKTARSPVLMAETWVQTPSIRRMGPCRAPCEATTSAAADAACLGCGSATRTVVRPCIVRLSLVSGTAHAR
eukprot:COSAG02_NODE_449_length_22094_cov_4.917027_13_plen_207_part_00